MGSKKSSFDNSRSEAKLSVSKPLGCVQIQPEYCMTIQTSAGPIKVFYEHIKPQSVVEVKPSTSFPENDYVCMRPVNNSDRFLPECSKSLKPVVKSILKK